MNWRRILNPWAALREAEVANAVLRERLTDACQRADEADGLAFYRAADHYWQRNRMVEAQLQHTQRTMVELAHLMPAPIVVVQKGEEA